VSIPKGVEMTSLSDRIADAIEGARVTHALFTTFTLDPGFFELEILPTLFPDRSFSHVQKARRVQLEDALRSGPAVSVFYDRCGLAQEGTPAHLGWNRVDVRWRTGIFHPKLTLLLVERDDDKDPELAPARSLIIGVASANLTRHGWWENVEVAHFVELRSKDHPRSRAAYRKDLLEVLRVLQSALPKDTSDPVRDAIHEFVRKETNTEVFRSATANGRYRTRIFTGQDNFPAWLRGLGIHRRGFKLELISPFFDGRHANTLAALIEATKPTAVRVYLPVDAEGTALVDEEAHAAIADLPGVRWGRLPEAMVKRSGNAKAARLSHRGVHAKVYRFWSADAGEVVIVGSINLTAPAHSHKRAGNLEIGVLVDHSNKHKSGWWLVPDEVEREHFKQLDGDEEREGVRNLPLDVSIAFDWRVRELRLRSPKSGMSVEVFEPTGEALFTHRFENSDIWQTRPSEDAERVALHLEASSFLLLRLDDNEWRVLVQETGTGYKPSLLSKLTPEEILQYWALLTAEQRQAYILDKLRAEELEGLPASGNTRRFLAGNSLFERFAGIFHSFGCLRRSLDEALDAGRVAEAEARLFGESYDSLPRLLARLAEAPSDDPTRDFVTVLCARQLRGQVRRQHPDFWKSARPVRARLDDRLKPFDDLGEKLGLEPQEREDFLAWYEKAFLEDVTPREARS